LMFAAMVALITVQGYWVAQLDMPYALRSLLAITSGVVLGYVASRLLILWIEADNAY
jgi:hypothetical protein